MLEGGTMKFTEIGDGAWGAYQGAMGWPVAAWHAVERPLYGSGQFPKCPACGGSGVSPDRRPGHEAEPVPCCVCEGTSGAEFEIVIGSETVGLFVYEAEQTEFGGWQLAVSFPTQGAAWCFARGLEAIAVIEANVGVVIDLAYLESLGFAAV